MEILGLIDALESTILSAPKLPLTNKIIIDEEKLLSILDKIRLVAKNGEHIIKENISVSKKIQKEKDQVKTNNAAALNNNEDLDVYQKQANEIMQQADDYASDVLEKLHLTVLKMQRNLTRVEKTIEGSKQALSCDNKSKEEEKQKENAA